MNEERGAKKRAHELAMDNLRNITEKLREERNDAHIKIQAQKRQITSAEELLTAVQAKISDLELSKKIKSWLESAS